jgi:surfeit locus 1 family protein
LSAAGGARGRRRRQPRSWLGLIVPALIVFAGLIALGTWQLERKAWKEALIETLTARLAAPPGPLPPPQAWAALGAADAEYRRVSFGVIFTGGTAALVYAAPSAFRPDVSGPGFWVMAPARLAGGNVVVVNRGFIPAAAAADFEQAAEKTRGTDTVAAATIEVVGAVRWPDATHWYTPKNDTAHNLWFVRDPAVIAAAKGWGPVAPFYVEQESPVPESGWPQPGKLVVRLPNNHLQYAVTWYGLALVLVVVFAFYARSSSRGWA